MRALISQTDGRRVRAAVALIVHPDRKMAAMRASSRDGRISLLGGGVDPGEDPADAAIREAEEESGGSIRVARVRLLRIGFSDDGVLCAGFLATRWEADLELRGSSEGPALWSSRADLLSPVDSAFPVWTTRLLEAYDAWLRLGPVRVA